MPNLAQTLYDDYRRFRGRPCIAVKRDGQYVRVPYEEMERRTARLALALIDLAVAPEDRVAIMSSTRPEWLTADHAIAAVGAVIVPIYPTLTAPVAKHILEDSGAKVAVVEGPREAARLREAGFRGALLAMQPGVEGAHPWPAGDEPADLDLPPIATRRAAIQDHWLVSFLYTSGTTGSPKGVIYDHERATGALHSLMDSLQLKDGDVALSFLPMSHALGRASTIAYFHSGVLNCFAESINTVAADFALVRPTCAFTVPRVFEKAYERLQALLKTSASKRRIFEWSLSVARAAWKEKSAGRRPGAFLASQLALADRLVFGPKVRARLGGRVRVLWSGGASLAPHIAEFFNLAGVPIKDVYGMSEFGLSHMTPQGAPRFGSCGRQTLGYEVKIAADGEILVRASHAMVGYHRLPEDTKSFRDPDGWMHSGDIGHIDPDGYLFITDRKKSLIVLSNGKKVAPTPLESRIASNPLAAQVVVIGEGRNYLTALIAPNRELASARGLDDAAIERELQSAIDAVNRDLPSFETIKRFAVLSRPLTEADGDLTPTLKVKRSEVARNFAPVIDRLYADAAASARKTGS